MMTPPPSRPLCLTLLIASLFLAAAGCAEADLPTSFEEPPVREASNNTTVTPRDMGRPTTDMASDMARDTGIEDMPTGGDLDPGTDLGGDMPSPDMTPGLDSPVDMPTPDMDLCGPDQCAPDSTECRGNTSYATCQRTIDGCWSFGRIETCPAASMCSNNACQVPPTCVDNDGDTYGANCLAGPDCNDNDRLINPGRAEVCDNKDNDCNNRVDDNITGAGDSCTSGQGVCQASGSLVCDGAAQRLLCNATPGAPSAEVCDGLDNNCDGQIDEGNICPCGDDLREPNNTRATGYVLARDTPTWNFSCATDPDFYRAPTTLVNGQRYATMLAYPVQLGELQLRMYKDGVVDFTTPLNNSDHTGIRFTYNSASTYDFEVIYNGTTENFYRINLIIEDTNCTSNPDFFEHNDSIDTASLFTPGWLTNAYACEDEDDWYYLGSVPSGETIDIEALFQTVGFFDEGDIDLELFADPQGDGTYERVAQATTGGDNEYLTHTTTHEGFYFLRLFSYDGVSNPYQLRMTR